MHLPIGDYALIGDCHSAALVSRDGSIDWCCLPRFDSDSCFGRLLDHRHGGHFAIGPVGRHASRRAYQGDSLVLVTTFESESGTVRLTDFFAMRRGGRSHPRRELIRIVEGLSGSMRLCIDFAPRFDYGEIKPWIYELGEAAYCAVGSNAGLLLSGDAAFARVGDHGLRADVEITQGHRLRLAMQFVPPEDLHATPAKIPLHSEPEKHLDETLAWWRQWASKMNRAGSDGVCVARSAIVLKALNHAPTGAIIAAPTTSLPEHVGGERNWDYRFSWIRDSVFTVRALSSLGCLSEADGFRRFIQRSCAGSAEQLQVLVAVDGKRRLTEIVLDHLEGWRGSRPVRIGNAADKQYQADMYGLLLELAWRWSARGNVPEPQDWEFLAEMVDAAVHKWPLPDHGIWEVRDAPRHFVHSKVMCWTAVHRGIALARQHGFQAPLARWEAARDTIREAVETEGYDAKRGVFRGSFGSTELDAALLLLPDVGFVAYDDPRMVRTAQAIAQDLDDGGLVLRYRMPDGMRGAEGSFVPCTFWLAECLARQGRTAEALERFHRACGCANDLGLFSEEYAASSKELLGNFPQGLTHLAHISAALALEGVTPESGSAG
ncbi:MAG: glycoside hydrolase family 15 protein [Burkholderiaceae bacterium]|nr:glycoside hydrolase family 15 protein [Burkholderiaceae bacterium]